MTHMSVSPLATGAQLTNALHTLGVKFIIGGNYTEETLHKHPPRLIAALAGSKEARLRLALIPLFLEHPEFAAYVRPVAANLNASTRLTLQCYYCAAVWLQQEYQARLESILGSKPSLPDHFSRELGLQQTLNDPEPNLQMLAERHQVLSGEKVNWLGTYRHAAQVWLKGLENRNA
jgi:hypothetical protein